ncbi:TIGR03943 family putative permease subunit [Heyndrickxia oleronia]|uniref:TIGR03943 family putative permease subunit n=1 Tax=Heyndrickxia oleronia TaxID=38875 RepID=UPI001C0F0FC4|nr:TIGR03943 family protein [Heyndrickxia oleronia]MBU5212951.1 TIGR03943 family protein [Heyndrickxia oleronia]
MEEQRLKFHIFLRGIILIGFTLLFYKLLISNQINYFIAPKMRPYLYFSTFVFMVLGIFQVFKGTSNKKETIFCDCCDDHHPPKTTFRSVLYYLIFIIPLLTGFLFSDHILGSSIAKNRDIQLQSSTSSNQRIGQTQSITQEKYNAMKQSLMKKSLIKVVDSNYLLTVGIIQDNLDLFVNKEIEITGFVHREEGFPPNQIIIGRFAISCCIADASVYGLMAKGKVTNLKNDSWVQVKGRLGKGDDESESILPVLEIESFKNIPEPKQPYVYDVFIEL